MPKYTCDACDEYCDVAEVKMLEDFEAWGARVQEEITVKVSACCHDDMTLNW
jgi:hypothetical protein